MSGVITNIDQLDLAHGLYTYADYIHWQLKERLEILKGKIFKMSPAPAVSHQKIARNLTGELYNYFKGKTCQFFSAPFDVVLGNKEGLEDILWRSYGILQYARRVSGKEALSKLSDIQLGVDLEILPFWGKDTFNELVAITRPNFLSKYLGSDNLTDTDRDSYRAKVIRQKLSN